MHPNFEDIRQQKDTAAIALPSVLLCTLTVYIYVYLSTKLPLTWWPDENISL